jgi:hypothetical protein
LNTAASQVSGQPEFFLASAPAVAQSDFWRHFDFAAVPANMANVPDGLNFIGIDALANDQSTVVTSLGQPRFRFGFNPVTGMSREHESVSPSARFIGRYLHAETSADFAGEDFNWPLRASSIGNPMDVTNSVTLSPTTGIVNEFDGPFGRGGMRRVEDVLLANVREFRVELWDSRLERWVVPGHQIVKNAGTPQAIAGDYHITRCWQRYSSTDLPNPDTISYGPLQIPASTVTPHVFDTWHPQIIRNINGNGVNELAERQAPYFPLKFYPPDQDGSTTRSGEIQVGPSSFRNPDPRAEFDPTATLPRSDVNQGYWRPSTTYQPGDVVFADRDLTPGWDANSDGVFDWSVDSAAIPKESLHYAYRCVGVVDTNFPPNSGTTVPGWQSPGLRFVDGNLLWEGFSNISPLKAVRLTIRFIEPTSETLKQLTLVMPITDEER